MKQFRQSISFLVLYCSDIEESRRFYSALGLEFEREQHGSGPKHLAALSNTMILELYPATEKRPPTSGVLLGFTVAARKAAIQAIRPELIVSQTPEDLVESGDDIFLQDPDGNRVIIQEALR